MQKITTLPLQEARKIAAGQVVDRPANVVKELVENALDAGATVINVTIHDAGQSLIRVVDNGCGMSPADAVKCFEHHATSKISCFDDLSQLKTFGFRGEALASIVAVSSITMLTKQEHDVQGTKVSAHSEKSLITELATCAVGTDISVVDLFFNVPVRKKFLKKDETESRAIITLMQAFALTYSHVHFQLNSENTLLLNCPKAVDLSNRVAQLWDAQLAKNLLTINHDEQPSFKITGLISNQQVTRYNRNQIFFFVNSRWVKNYQLSQALIKGYMPTLQPGRYPAAFVHIEVDPHDVDINIHPRKEEVLFAYPLKIEKALQNLVRTMLEKNVSHQLQQGIVQPERQLSSMPAAKSSSFSPYIERSEVLQPASFVMPTSAQIAYQTMQSEAPIVETHVLQESMQQEIVIHEVVQEEVQIKAVEQIEFKVLGVFSKTYILVEQAEGILMVDQHAAHERILYERFSKRFDDCASIQLLFPEVVTLSREEYALLVSHMPVFEQNGIILEPFGDRQVLVQATPVHLKNIAWHAFLQETIVLMQEERELSFDDVTSKLNHALQAQMACKAAVKAGDSLSEEQIQKLLYDLHTTENRFSCPHGRPTSWLLPQYDIEKKFKRKL